MVTARAAAPPAATVLSISLADADNAVPSEFRGRAVAIGNFDGVHRGHQALIGATVAEAKRLGVLPGILTFEPHPRAVLRPDLPTFRLTPSATKARLVGAVGAPLMVELRFDPGVAALTPDAFIEEVLVRRLGVRAVLVGEGFRFGNKRAGDFALLAEAGRQHGFIAREIAPITDPSDRVYASGLVRTALGAGEIADANAILGYRWITSGEVQHGDKRGRELGYPTANLPMPTTGLRHGIYAVAAALPGELLPRRAVASVGIRPTFGGGDPLLEVHIFDFDGDLYGAPIDVAFVDWLRPEERFDSIDALVRQIDHDADTARAILAAAGEGTALDRALQTGATVAAESPIA